MISLHRSMHSSQMYTPGPAMSFLTCFCDLPQNEHLSRSPPSPMRATYDPFLWDIRPLGHRSVVPPVHSPTVPPPPLDVPPLALCREAITRTAAATGTARNSPGPVRTSSPGADRVQLPGRDDLVDDPIVLALGR